MVEICAHRGESWTHVENTLPAVAAALATAGSLRSTPVSVWV